MSEDLLSHPAAEFPCSKNDVELADFRIYMVHELGLSRVTIAAQPAGESGLLYLKDARPPSSRRFLFLTLDSFRPVRDICMPVSWRLKKLKPTLSLMSQARPAAAGGIGFINSCGLIGGFMSPSIIGWIKQSTGSLTYGLVFMAALLVIAAVTILFQTKDIN